MDVKVSPQGKYVLLDEEEYRRHGIEMNYSKDLQLAIKKGLDRLMVDIRLRNSPFEHREINRLYEKYLVSMELEGLVE